MIDTMLSPAIIRGVGLIVGPVIAALGFAELSQVPGARVEIASEASAAGPGHVIIQAVNVTQRSWIDDVLKEHERVYAESTERPESDDSDSLQGREGGSGRLAEDEADHLAEGQ